MCMKPENVLTLRDQIFDAQVVFNTLACKYYVKHEDYL